MQRNRILLNNLNRGGPGFNVAHVVSTLDIEVTTQTPSSTPGITDDPVISSGSSARGSSGSVSYNDDGVVNVGGIGDDASRIAVDSATLNTERKTNNKNLI